MKCIKEAGCPKRARSPKETEGSRREEIRAGEVDFHGVGCGGLRSASRKYFDTEDFGGSRETWIWSSLERS